MMDIDVKEVEAIQVFFLLGRSRFSILLQSEKSLKSNTSSLIAYK